MAAITQVRILVTAFFFFVFCFSSFYVVSNAFIFLGGEGEDIAIPEACPRHIVLSLWC